LLAIVVSFCAVCFPGLQVLTETPLMVACWTTSLLPITLTLEPTVRAPEARAAAEAAVGVPGGSVARLGWRLSAAIPERLNGVDAELA